MELELAFTKIKDCIFKNQHNEIELLLEGLDARIVFPGLAINGKSSLCATGYTFAQFYDKIDVEFDLLLTFAVYNCDQSINGRHIFDSLTKYQFRLNCNGYTSSLIQIYQNCIRKTLVVIQ